MFQVTSGELLVCVGGNHCSSALDSGWWSTWFTNILLHYIDYNKNTSYTYLIYIYTCIECEYISIYLYHITVYPLLDSHIYHYILHIYVFFFCDIHLLAPMPKWHRWLWGGGPPAGAWARWSHIDVQVGSNDLGCVLSESRSPYQISPQCDCFVSNLLRCLWHFWVAGKTPHVL